MNTTTPLSDIVERLREWALNRKPTRLVDALVDDLKEAASEIETLRAKNEAFGLAVDGLEAEIETLREFAETIIAMCVPMDPPADNPVPEVIASVMLHLANKALGESHD